MCAHVDIRKDDVLWMVTALRRVISISTYDETLDSRSDFILFR